MNSEEVIECDLIMYATGRKPLTENIGLQKCGVKLNEQGAIVVNSNYQTNIDSIYAIGDVTDRVNLTPVALAEGMALTAHLYQDTEKPVSYDYIPSAVFSNPNLATVGHTETEAKKKFGDIVVYRSSFTPLKHTLSGSDEKTLLKLIVDRKSNKVIGAHMVGADAGELIQGIAIALKAGATKSHFDQTIGIHPTTAEEWVTMRTPV